MKKFVSLLLALVLILAMSSVAMAEDASVSTADEFKNALSQAVSGDTVTLLQNVNLTGKVSIFVPDGVTIDGGNNTLTVADVYNGTANALFYSKGNGGGSYNVQDLTVNLISNVQQPIAFDMTNGGTLTNVTVKGAFGMGVYVEKDTTISGCTFSNNGNGSASSGVYPGEDASKLGEIVITENTFETPIATILRGENTSFTGNTVDSDGEGVSVATASAEITGNTFTGTTAITIYVPNVTVAKNNILDGAAVNIAVSYSNADLSGNYWDGAEPSIGGSGAASATVDSTLDNPVDETGEEVIPTPAEPKAAKRYDINVADTKNGDVAVKKSASYDSGVVITATPYYGYEVGTVTVTDADGDAVKVTNRADGTYSFSMPRGEVAVKVTFVAQGEAVKMVLTIGSKDVVINGDVTTNDVAPVIINGRTFLPIRVVAEALGATVEWDNDAQTVTITKGDTVIVLTIGSTTVYVNGQPAELEAPVFIENSRTYLPVRLVAEALGADVEWNGVTNEVTITGRK